MLERFKNLSPMIKFILKFLLLLGAWELVYTLWIEPDGRLDYHLTSWVSNSSLWFLDLFGQTMQGELGEGDCQVIYGNGVRLLHVAHPCNGLILQVLFVSFLLCFEGNLIIKTITISLGCLGIYIINVLRVVALILIKINYPEYLDFSHKWLFTVIVYAFVFSLWLLWINKLSKISFSKQ